MDVRSRFRSNRGRGLGQRDALQLLGAEDHLPLQGFAGERGERGSELFFCYFSSLGGGGRGLGVLLFLQGEEKRPGCSKRKAESFFFPANFRVAPCEAAAKVVLAEQQREEEDAKAALGVTLGGRRGVVWGGFMGHPPGVLLLFPSSSFLGTPRIFRSFAQVGHVHGCGTF